MKKRTNKKAAKTVEVEATESQAVETVETQTVEAETAESVKVIETQAVETETAKKPAFRQSRWVKVHEQGQDFEAKSNVMDITFSEIGYQAEITYRTLQVRNFSKAVYWFLRGLTNARADVIAQLATNELTAQADNAGKETKEISVSGNGWECKVANSEEGVFKVSMSWTHEATENAENGEEKPENDGENN